MENTFHLIKYTSNIPKQTVENAYKHLVMQLQFKVLFWKQKPVEMMSTKELKEAIKVSSTQDPVDKAWVKLFNSLLKKFKHG